jgi:hypothetical protein
MTVGCVAVCMRHQGTWRASEAAIDHGHFFLVCFLDDRARSEDGKKGPELCT